MALNPRPTARPVHIRPGRLFPALAVVLLSLALCACAARQSDYPQVQVRGQYDFAIGGTHYK